MITYSSNGRWSPLSRGGRCEFLRTAWPRHDGDVSRFAKWLTATHARRWNESHGTVGRGAVYQSRFRCVWVETDEHLLRTWSYIERNPLNADLVVRAEDWRWCSLWRRTRGPHPHPLCEGPVRLPTEWVDLLNVRVIAANNPRNRKVGSDPRVPVRGSDPTTNELGAHGRSIRAPSG